MGAVTIQSDGRPNGTKVKVGNEYMDGVMRIDIDPIVPGRLVIATITVNVKLELAAKIKRAE